jgi:hypothetical protein
MARETIADAFPYKYGEVTAIQSLWSIGWNRYYCTLSRSPAIIKRTKRPGESAHGAVAKVPIVFYVSVGVYAFSVVKSYGCLTSTASWNLIGH